MSRGINHPRQPRRLREATQIWKQFQDHYPGTEIFGAEIGLKLPKRLFKLYMRFAQLEEYERLAESRIERFRREKEVLRAQMAAILAARKDGKP